MISKFLLWQDSGGKCINFHIFPSFWRKTKWTTYLWASPLTIFGISQLLGKDKQVVTLSLRVLVQPPIITEIFFRTLRSGERADGQSVKNVSKKKEKEKKSRGQFSQLQYVMTKGRSKTYMRNPRRWQTPAAVSDRELTATKYSMSGLPRDLSSMTIDTYCKCIWNNSASDLVSLQYFWSSWPGGHWTVSLLRRGSSIKVDGHLELWMSAHLTSRSRTL